ncbi:MAG: aminopeptidase P family protein [Vulcanimicrobiaceae bacterium]
MSQVIPQPTPAVAPPAAVAPTAPHDEAQPPALLDFMVAGWAPRDVAFEPLEAAQRFRERRERLSAAFPGDLLIVPSGHEKTRANDTTYRFRPGTDFYYLTGNLEPDCVLVLAPGAHGPTATLYVEPNVGKTDATFYTDRAKGELWVGPRLGVAESAARFGCDARALADLENDLAAARDKAHATRLLRGIDPNIDAQYEPQSPPDGSPADDPDRALAETLSEFRLIKDDYEIEQLERAIASTKSGFDDVLRGLPAAKTERYVEGLFNMRARIDGNDVGYGTIAASGRHACTLHWTSNDGALHANDLLLLDAGVEAHTLYTADVTRTVPMSGRFSREQREIYDLVFAAQNAAFEKCKPGEDFLAPNTAAMVVLARGLERLGILPMPADEALLATNQFYKRYSLHNVSHMLGLDVHDCARARAQNYKYGKLEPGMVLTVEPGLYLQPDDLTVPERYRGIGVRIEDDIVITPTGHRNLTAHFPRAPDDVEAWVRTLRG